MSEFIEDGKLWFNGKMVEWQDAKIHVMSHVIHYGSSVFEGFRCYNTVNGPALFRLKDHIRRLFDSAKIYRIPMPFSKDVIEQACIDVVKVNNLQEAYMRPVVFRGYGSLGVDPKDTPTEVAVAALTWGKYLGDEGINVGVDVRVSSWNRARPNTFPAMAKCGANYMNSQLINLEAKADGYIEGIGLDSNGYVSEGSGENIFVIRDNRIYTPPLSSSILPGITRDCVIKLAEDFGYKVEEITIPREFLYIADEVFFTGSAAEVSPIKSIDRIPIGEGRRGPITEKIQKRFFGILTGEFEDKYSWLTPVN
ncbi:branched-chain amino acid transaminase [candidate division KSB1 bacterium]|nr:branched-chain amino acid transaminase [candidate division KSB1 bacterium]